MCVVCVCGGGRAVEGGGGGMEGCGWAGVGGDGVCVWWVVSLWSGWFERGKCFQFCLRGFIVVDLETWNLYTLDPKQQQQGNHQQERNQSTTEEVNERR